MNSSPINQVTALIKLMRLITALSLIGVMVSACGNRPLMIKGRVTDTTGAVISGARVQTEPFTDPVTTNQSGHFVITRQLVNSGASQRPLKAGRYLVVITAEGYQEGRSQVTLNKSNTDESPTYRLKRDVGTFQTQGPEGGQSDTRVDKPRPPKFGPP